MSLLRWEPLRDIMSMREAIDRLTEETIGERLPWRPEGVPLDIYDKDDSLVVKASLPGVKPEDMNVTVQDNILTITAETKSEEEIKRPSIPSARRESPPRSLVHRALTWLGIDCYRPLMTQVARFTQGRILSASSPPIGSSALSTSRSAKDKEAA